MARAETGEFAFARREEPTSLPRFLVDVALKKPLRQEFTYSVPPELAEQVAPGTRVAVPFGMRREFGVVVALRAATDLDPRKVRSIARVLDETPLLDGEILTLTRWIADYYACAWGEALAAVLPAALKREGESRKVSMMRAVAALDPTRVSELSEKKPRHHRMLRALVDAEGPVEVWDLCRRTNLSPAFAKTLVKLEFASVERVAATSDPLESSRVERPRPEKLSADQETARAAIVAKVETRAFGTFLLQGVTGSGKTEVYLRVIEAALALGRGAIVVVPEIALTPQTVGWFRSRFGAVAVLHSRMTDAQRRETWLAVKRGEIRVVVGARSAIFAPVKDLGVIVVDEEHEPSYKQAETPRYHARDVAVVRAKNLNAVCVLGSATPSLESWTNARAGRYTHLYLRERVGGGRLPAVEVIDLRQEKPDGKSPALFSHRLKTMLAETLAKKEQAILFLNRRGFAPVLWCGACGESVRCANCDIALTFHRRIGRAVCHSCCEEIVPPKACPACTAPKLHYMGAGSERVEATLAKLLPTARIARMDSDTMHKREDYERVLDRFAAGDIDVLVGTQMIAKGLDFPRVTLVGIVSADSSLHQPDFRASERTFQLLAQVAGRAGRGVLSGRIVVQTATPGHPAIRFAAQHDFEGFAAHESRLRAELHYPPHGRLVRLVIEDKDAVLVEKSARELGDWLRPFADAEKLVILGPAEAPISLLRGKTRWHLLVKGPLNGKGLANIRTRVFEWLATHPKLRVAIDVDPVSLM